MDVDTKTFEQRLGVSLVASRRLQSVVSWLSNDQHLLEASDQERFAIAGHSLARFFSGEYYFRTYPERREGSMTKWRDLFLDRYFHLLARPMGLVTSKPSSRRSLVRAVEMVFGALYASEGFRACQISFSACAVPTLRNIVETMDLPTLILSDKVERILRSHASYRRVEVPENESDPFVVECIVSGICVGVGRGRSVWQAESAAARVALDTFEGWKGRAIAIAEANAERNEKLYARKRISADHIERMIPALERRLDVTFKDCRLLVQALSHRSYAHEYQGSEGHNERLEFLGDALLEWIVTEFLLRKYPNDPDAVRRYVGALVSNRRLSQVAATSLRLSEAVLLGCGVRTPSAQMLADAFEAVIAAIYLDQGIGASRLTVDALLNTHLTQFLQEHRFLRIKNPKTGLNNLAMRRKLGKPTYHLEEIVSEDGSHVWRCEVKIDERTVGTAIGQNKKQAEAFAADDGLNALSGEPSPAS